MSTRRGVIMALKALVATALPLAKIRGFDLDTARPGAIPSGGVVIGHPGDPGEPQIDLSPPLWTFDHPITIEFAPSSGGDQAAQLDEMIGAFGAAIAGDRTLGGLCHWMEARPPNEDDTESGSGSQRWGVLDVIASYSTTDPLN